MIKINSPYQFFYDLAGNNLENGNIYIGTANTDPRNNPITVYWDAAGTIPAQQPLRTIGGVITRAGTPSNIYTASDYSLSVYDSDNVFLYNVPSWLANDTENSQNNYNNTSNKIINGDFRSRTDLIGSYPLLIGTNNLRYADKWNCEINATNTTLPSVSNIADYLRPKLKSNTQTGFFFTRDGLTSNKIILSQKMDSVETLNGKTCTLSFKSFTTGESFSFSVKITQYFGLGGSATSIIDLGSFTASSTVIDNGKSSVVFSLPDTTSKTIGNLDDHYLELSFDITNLITDIALTEIDLRQGLGVREYDYGFRALEFLKSSISSKFDGGPIGLRGNDRGSSGRDNLILLPTDSFINKIINPSFFVSQRGTSGSISTSALGGYSLDGWRLYNPSGGSWNRSSAQISSWAYGSIGGEFRTSSPYSLSIPAGTFVIQNIESNVASTISASIVMLTIDMPANLPINNPVTLTCSYANSVDNFSSVTLDFTDTIYFNNSVTTVGGTPKGRISYVFEVAELAYNGYQIKIGIGNNTGLGNIDLRLIYNYPLGVTNKSPIISIRPPSVEQQICNYYYQTGKYYWRGHTLNNANHGGVVSFETSMRISPTVTTANSGTPTNFASVASTTANVSTNEFEIYRLANATGSGNYADTWTASAEL